MNARRGLTLFEIVISTLILTVAVLSAVAMLPAGIEAETNARARLYASVVAMNFMHSFHNAPTRMDARSDTDYISTGQLALDDGTLNREQIDAVDDGDLPMTFANGLRRAGLFNSANGYDFEKVLLDRNMGLIPLPAEIAIRLRDDNDEIQQLLRDGGSLYYVDPQAVRSMTDNARGYDRDGDSRGALSTTARYDEALHRLVVGVLTPPQQNLLQVHPWDMQPLYEMYPFPPQWKELGTGVVYYNMKNDLQINASNEIDLNGEKGRDKGGHDIHFRRGTIIGQALNAWPTDAFIHDPQPGIDGFGVYDFDDQQLQEELEYRERRHGYHGRNWRALAMREKDASGISNPANSSPGERRQYKWLAGWPAFRQLAGNPQAGWLPITGLLGARCEYEPAQWHPLLELAKDTGTATDTMEDKAKKYLNAKALDGHGKPFNSWNNKKGLEWNLNDITENLPDAPIQLPTYEMRASYRDHALRLWDAVRPFDGSAANSGDPDHVFDIDTSDFSAAALELDFTNRSGANKQTVRAAGLTASAFAAGYNSTLPTAQYGIPVHAIAGFRAIDPYALINGDPDLPDFSGIAADDFPPHPAQVMALSYLAHSAMMVSGWMPPFEARLYPQDGSRESDDKEWDAFPQDGMTFTADHTASYLTKGRTFSYIDYQVNARKDTFEIVHIDPSRQWFLMRHNRALTASDIASVVDNVVDASAYDDPGWLDPEVSADPDKQIDFARRTTVLHPGDCIWMNSDDGDLVYEVAGIANATSRALDELDPVVITAEQNSPVVVNALSAGDAAITSANLVQVYVRRVYRADYHKGHIYDQTLDGRLAGTTSPTPGQPIEAIRVATPQDVDFARKVHEMCIRWAVAYAAENPYDWGAPRPANNQTAWDKPLVMFDLFNNGTRAPEQADLGTHFAKPSSEPFLRWVMPPNPQALRYPEQLSDRIHMLSNQTPIDVPPEVHWQLVDTYYTDHHGDDNDSSANQPAFWATQPFDPQERCRELVFWAVPWKQYEDAESVPSAAVDLARTTILTTPFPSGTGGKTPYETGWDPLVRDSRWRHPEMHYAFNESRTGVAGIDSHKMEDDRFYQYLGSFGADRNMNGRYDVGDIPKSVTLRPKLVARFNFYDPILPLHGEN